MKNNPLLPPCHPYHMTLSFLVTHPLLPPLPPISHDIIFPGDSSPPEIYISRTNLTTFLYFSHNSKIRDVFLTFGHNYSIACRKVGLSAVSVIWYNENTAVGTSNSERVYVMQQDSTTMTLKITLFRESDKGLYHCRAGDGSASLMITDGEWVRTVLVVENCKCYLLLWLSNMLVFANWQVIGVIICHSDGFHVIAK